MTALLSVTQDWLTVLDERKDIHCTFFDLQKAFDKVPHRRLMAKLEQLQLNKPLLKWINSYLLNREQSVLVNGVESEFVQVISGVPQGSVLGPLLFLIYINDVASIKLSVNTKLSLYADDMLLYKVITSSEDYAELQEDINLIHNWSVNNLMTFNASKCKCMYISRKRERRCPSVSLDNATMEYVTHYKYLGVVISSDMTWTSHIQHICNKTKRIIGMLYRNCIKYTSDSSANVRMYLAYAHPILEYPAQVWSPYTTKDTQLLEKVQKFALRVCTSNYNMNYDELLDISHVPTLENRRLFLCLCTFYNFIHGFVFFPPHLLPNLCNTRTNYSLTYNIPFAHTTSLQHSFLHTVLHFWNNLPEEAVSASSVSSFKHTTRPLFS